jgi:hypothetical protein
VCGIGLVGNLLTFKSLKIESLHYPILGMKELKIACPACGGHVAYPPAMAGQAITCPHCQTPIALGTKTSSIIWVLLSATILLSVVCIAMIFWYIGQKQSRTAPNTSIPESKSVASVATEKVAPQAAQNESEIETLCRMVYELRSNRDFESIYRVLAAPCKSAITVADIDRFSSPGWTYKLKSLESITYLDGDDKKIAVVKCLRSCQFGGRESEDVRDIKCVKEPDGWKLFDEFEWAEVIIDEAAQSGITESVSLKIQQYCSSNPFQKWPSNVTNAFAQIYAIAEPDTRAVFPWELSYKIKGTSINKFALNVMLAIKNNSNHPWDSPRLTFSLKQDGLQLSDNPFLNHLNAGEETVLKLSFIHSLVPDQPMLYNLDAFYVTGFDEHKFCLASNVPINFRVPSITNSLRFELVSRSFTRLDFKPDYLTGRLDYRVRNVSALPVTSVKLRFVWHTMNGDELSQTTEDVVSSYDLPLEPRQFKVGYGTCGVGYKLRRVPVTVDIYFEDDVSRCLVYKGLLID